MAKEVKKTTTPTSSLKGVAAPKSKMQFAFGTKNYIMLLAGGGLMIIGYMLLAGGGSNDPNVFNPELFSTQRMVVAPLILLLGFIVVGVSILYHPEDKESSTELK
jgi:hypothetical protein